jgi:hypothetical protein
MLRRAPDIIQPEKRDENAAHYILFIHALLAQG